MIAVCYLDYILTYLYSTTTTQGYYSIVIHIYIDLHINFRPMSVADTLDYIAFFAFRCNGTTVLAEMHRVIMQDTDMYRIRASLGNHFYEFLYELADNLYPDVRGVGSCTEFRYTYFAGNNYTRWCLLQQELLDLCALYYKDEKTCNTKNAIKECTRNILHTLVHGKNTRTKKNLFCGVGAMGAMQFVHIASLLGLIPMYCYTYAEIMDNKLGPPRFIRLALDKEENEMSLADSNQFLHDLHKDFSAIWGPMMTLSMLENTLCELSRAYKSTSARAKKANNPKSTNADIIMDESVYCDGKTVDITFFDEQRNTVQNFFLVRTQGADGASELRPVLVMKHSKNWNSNFDDKQITLTSWCCDDNDKKNMMWEHRPPKRNLKSKLEVSKKLRDMMLLSFDS